MSVSDTPGTRGEKPRTLKGCQPRWARFARAGMELRFWHPSGVREDCWHGPGVSLADSLHPLTL